MPYQRTSKRVNIQTEPSEQTRTPNKPKQITSPSTLPSMSLTSKMSVTNTQPSALQRISEMRQDIKNDEQVKLLKLQLAE